LGQYAVPILPELGLLMFYHKSAPGRMKN